MTGDSRYQLFGGIRFFRVANVNRHCINLDAGTNAGLTINSVLDLVLDQDI